MPTPMNVVIQSQLKIKVICSQLKIKGICILQIFILFLSEMEVYK